MSPYICTTWWPVHTDPLHQHCYPFYWADVLAKDPNISDRRPCIIKGKTFVRGVIEIPVHDYEYAFEWAWVSA